MPLSDEERRNIDHLGAIFAQRPQMVVHEMVRRRNAERVLVIGFVVDMQGRRDFFPYAELIQGLPQDHYIPLDPNLLPRDQPLMPISDFAAGARMGNQPASATLQGALNELDRSLPQGGAPEGPAAVRPHNPNATLLPGLGGPRRDRG